MAKTATHSNNKNSSFSNASARDMLFFIALILLPSSWGQTAGSRRVAACSREKLPERYTEFLDTSFLGPALQISVGRTSNITYHRFGPLEQGNSTGRPLVMIAGVRCTLSTWTPDLLKTLAATRTLVVFDNKGVGLSTDTEWPDDVSIQSYAQSTVDLISALELDQPDVLGWSMGGVIALWMATHYPGEVNRYVIVNSAAGPVDGHNPALAAPPLGPGPDNTQKTQLDPTLIFPDTPSGNAALCRYLKLFDGMPKDGVTNQQAALQLKAVTSFISAGGVVSQLANITNPTLMVVGTATGEGPASYDMLSKIPNSALLGYGDAGHGAIFQHSLSAAVTISNFLDSEFE